MTVYFRMAIVRNLVSHAKFATERISVFDHGFGSQSSQKSNPVIPPGLILVKDDGVYLRSNGKLPDGGTPRKSLFTGYTIGFDPLYNPEQQARLEDAIGGNDCAEFMSLEWLGDDILSCRYGFLYITLAREGFEVGWTERMPDN